jgi:hypothetical protein
MRALALWIMGLLGGSQNDSHVATLLEDETEVSIYLNGKHQVYRVSDLAKEALTADV